MKHMNFNKYMERIGFKGNQSISIRCLSELHRKHVMSIPFEAMDVYFRIPIQLELKAIYDKVVVKNRGGYCYELNYLFYALLSHIGFNCYPVSVRIYNEENLGPDFDHMSIIVEMEDRWLVDVGYGDLFVEPIKLSAGLIQEDLFKNYKIEKVHSGNFLLTESLKNSNTFIKRYMIDMQPRKIDEFLVQNKVKQKDRDSFFVKNRICTIATQDGRKTILNNEYKRTSSNQIEKMYIDDEKQLLRLLKTEFNIELQR